MFRHGQRRTLTVALIAIIAVGPSSACSSPETQAKDDTGRSSSSVPSGAATSASVRDAVAASPPIPADAKAALEMPAVDAADPTFPIADQKRFAVIAFGTIAEISAGPELPVFEGDPEPIETIVVTVEVIKAFRGEQVPASRIYVRLVGGELESLRKAVPIGTNTVVSVEPVDKSFDEVLIDPQAGVPQGEARYIAGPTYFAVADGPESTWFPLLGITAKQPLDNLVGRADGGDGG